MKPFALFTALLLTGVVVAGDVPTDQLPTDQFPTDQIPTDQMPWNFPTDQLPAEFMGGWDGKYESLLGEEGGLIGLRIEKQSGWDVRGRLMIGRSEIAVQGLVDADGRCAMVGLFEPNRDGDEKGLVPAVRTERTILMVGQIRVDERGAMSFAGCYLVVLQKCVVDVGYMELMHKPF